MKISDVYKRQESLNVKDVSLVEVLDKALKGKNVVYKIDDNVVYLSLSLIHILL